MNEIIGIVVSSIFINNIILTKFLGLCPFFGVSTKLKNSLGMGVAVIFVMTMSSVITWFLYNWLMVPLGLEYLYIVAFILVISSFVQLTETFVKNKMPKVQSALGVYLPLITTNCAIMGIVLINNIQEGYSLLNSTVSGASTGVGFTLALLLMAGIRERLMLADTPDCLEGMPIAFISAACLALAFQGFAGMFI